MTGESTERVLLVGNGAVFNGWEPVRTAFKRQPPLPFHESESGDKFYFGKHEAHVLAAISHTYRTSRDTLLFDPEIARKTQGNFVETLLDLVCNIQKFKKVLAEEFSHAASNKTISIRSDISRVVRWLNESPGPAHVFTTNWDGLLFDSLQSRGLVPVNHLHGNTVEPYSLMLPTELSTDYSLSIGPYSFAPRVELLSTMSGCARPYVGEILNNSFPEASQRRMIASAHSWAVECLSRAQELFIWGLGFNVYDAELYSILTMTNSQKMPFKKITLLDTNPSLVALVECLLHTNDGVVVREHPTDQRM